MQSWLITLHGPAGVVDRFSTGETQFVLGSEVAGDVLNIGGSEVQPRHAVVWIAASGMQVEAIGGETLVNGHRVTERVETRYPASVQVGEVTVVVEEYEADPSTAVTVMNPGQSGFSREDPEATVVTAPRDEMPLVVGAGQSYAHHNGRYALVREIARGGMGQIYFGEDPQLKRQVAVKVSSLALGGEDPRFVREAEVLAHLAHPHIVPIHAIGKDAQGRPCYSMKLVRGRTLQAVLNAILAGDPVSVRDYPRATLLTIFRKVCDALAFAHSKGILHRDLKPENIMVGEYGEVLVMDWGLAKVLGEGEEGGAGSKAPARDTGDYGMTMEGEVMGTPQYMSPEQAEGMVGALDARSDVYSLGGILYALLTLRAPIEGKTLNEVLTKVKKGEITSMASNRGGAGGAALGTPAAMGAEVPEALQAVTLKAMATDRDQRYATVEAFAKDIEAYQNGFATVAEQAGAFRQVSLFVKRHKALASAAALFLVAATAFTLRLAASEKVARANERLALEEGEKSRRSEAEALMALAEAAEADSDAVTLERALSKVSGDLRTPDWQYLRDQIETAKFTLNSGEGETWVALEDWPSDPERMLVLSSEGQLFGVDLKSGVLEPLWKFNPPGKTRFGGSIGVSIDGTLVALGYLKGSELRAEVFNLKDGTSVGAIQCGEKGGRFFLLSHEVCARVGSDTVEVFDFRSGQRLWQASAGYAQWSLDHKSLLVLNKQGVAERREILSGNIVATGVPESWGFHDWIPYNGMGAEDWQRIFLPRGLSKSLRVLDPWKGRVDYEVTPKHGNFASALIPPGNFFATVGQTPTGGAVLEIRSARTGDLSRSLCTLSTVGRLGSAPRLCAKSGMVAVNFRNALKIWHLETKAPGLKLSRGGFEGLRVGSSTLVVTLAAGQKIVLFDGGKGSPQSSKIAERTIALDAYEGHITPDGTRLLLYRFGGIAGYRIGSAGFEELFSKRGYPQLSGYPLALHPSEDRLWAGTRVFEFSTGRELVTVNRGNLIDGKTPVWLALNRVAEIAQGGESPSARSESDRVPLRIALWDAESGTLLATAPAQHAEWICGSPDGLHLAEAGADKRVRIRNARTLEIEREFRAHDSPLTGIVWHPTLPLLVTVARDGVFRIWNTDDFRKVEEWLSAPYFDVNNKRKVYLQIPTGGRELSVYRMGEILVYGPASFQAGQLSEP
jgi:hypothetical protein